MKILKCLCVGLLLCSVYNSLAQQISTENTSSLEALIQANLGQGCVDISNVSTSVNGVSNGLTSYGSFNKENSNFPFENGIVLSTGSIFSAGNTVNPNTLNEGSSSWPTDPDLENTLGISGTLNATSIEFDFVSAANQIAFNYILASEEYNSNFPCQYSDGFAFLIKQAGTSDPYTNIALIPGSTIPVNTNTIHDEIVGFCPAENEIYFEGYNIGDTNYNGRTTVLTARADITPNVQYKIKLIIADQTDQNYDSAVFIEGTSTIASVDLGSDINTCTDSAILNGDVQNPTAGYQWYLNGALIPGAINPIYLATISGTYRLEVELQINNTICLIEDEIVVNLNSVENLQPLSDFSMCDDSSEDGFEIFNLTSKDTEALNLIGAGNYNISYHLTNIGALTGTSTITAPWQNTSNPQTIHVRIENQDTGCLAFTSVDLVVNGLPEIVEPTDIVVCDDGEADGVTEINLFPTINEVTSITPGLSTSFHTNMADAESGLNPIQFPYTNTNPTETLFIRIIESSTGCLNTTTVNINVLENPMLNPEIQWISACEINGDGIEIFDLTAVIDDILQGQTGITVEFYETETDAIDEINPIADATNYQNVTPNFQLVYIRVTNAAGCFSIAPIELHTNVIETGFITSSFGLCDDTSNDGVVDFDLAQIEVSLANGYEGFDITFFETENDQLNDINPINKNDPYTVTTTITELFVTVENDFCTVYTTIDLVINPAIEIQPLDTVEYCDTDFDGLTSIYLPTFDDYVGTGIDFPSAQYYLTEDDAINNENVLPDSYENTVNPVTLYVRVTNGITRCHDVSPIEILVIDPPVVMQPNDIVICDDDQDGMYVVNLGNKIPEIVADTQDLEITFHTIYDHAAEDNTAITDTNNYNANTQTLFVRVENQITTCFSIVEFDIFVNTLPLFEPITTFVTCENDNNQINDFYFNLKDNEILNGQTGKDVLYFETAQDAIDRTNIIDKFNAYQNLSNPQTIFVRVENLTDVNCFDTSSMLIEVQQTPNFNPPTDITVCDDISNDEFETFDISPKIDEISDGITENLDISFHLSFDDANIGQNNLPLTYTNQFNPQQIYVRIENGTGCYVIEDFELNVVQVPDVNPAPNLVLCDTDYDGFTSFDLTVVETDVLDVRADNIEISYHETLEGADTNSEVISNPEDYTNISNPQTVYIKIYNNISECYSLLTFDLTVNLPPLINDFQTHEICTNDNSSFDLSIINDIVLVDPTDVLIDYYATLIDAESTTNALDTNYTYSSNSDSIYIRVENLTTGCFYIYPFQLIVNPLPIANQPPDIQTCDDASNDGVGTFDLFSANNAILGTQDPNVFSVSYYTSLSEADLGTNPLSNEFIGQHENTIYARVENTITGCYSLTQFNLITNIHPEIPSALINCDDDYDGLTTFDLTLAETDLFTNVNPDNIISYFESVEDLENDVNAINNPSNYNTISNPQTVFIRVFNTAANCFTYVPLELNVNLPPAIDAFDTFELCETDSGFVTLSEINAPLLEQSANVIIMYYASEDDAINQINELNTEYEYQTLNDVIYARVEFSTTHCFYIHDFNLIVNPLPVANMPDDLVDCDDDYDGLSTFDLSNQTAQVLNGQDSNLFTVTYHNDLLSAEDNENVLDINYEASSNETIYVRVENIETACYDITSFDIIIHPKPIVDIGPQVICLEDLPLTVSANTNQAGDSYLWSTNETTPEIEISEIGTYSVTITSVFGCETIEVFNVTESEAASIVFTESIDFSDPNNVIVTVVGIGDYLYQLDDNIPQSSNVFQNVPLGYHNITVYDSNGCASITKEIVVIDAPKFMTPNGDGKFDTWHITGVESLPGTIIYIFDRYGKLLKTLTSNSPGWNGYYNGSLMPNSDYWYLAKVKSQGKSFEVKGHFSLRY